MVQLMDLITNNTVLTFLHLDVDISPSNNCIFKIHWWRIAFNRQKTIDDIHRSKAFDLIVMFPWLKKLLFFGQLFLLLSWVDFRGPL